MYAEVEVSYSNLLLGVSHDVDLCPILLKQQDLALHDKAQ